ncbi:hypothetical protein [Mariniphaga sp.]|uniref:hypothetical protein n=1 Tax=Mariniphaga sp. TaxID=1954475 RepID=UPI003569A0DF
MDTKKTNQKLKTVILLTTIFQVFNGLSGLVGGFGLINNPNGEALAMSTDWLQSTPFTNFLIPGIVLFTFNGLGNMAGFVATLRKHKQAARIATAFGLIMIVWIIAQVSWIGYKSFLQPLYFSTGLFQFVFGYIWMNKIKNNE